MQQLSPEGPLLSQTDKVLKKFSPAWLTNKKRKTIRAAYQAEGYFLTAFVSWAAIDRVRGSDAKFSLCRRTAGSAQLLHMKLFVIHYQLNVKCTSRRHIKSLDPVPLPCVSIKAAAIPYRKPEPFQEHRSGGCAGLWAAPVPLKSNSELRVWLGQWQTETTADWFGPEEGERWQINLLSSNSGWRRWRGERRGKLAASVFLWIRCAASDRQRVQSWGKHMFCDDYRCVFSRLQSTGWPVSVGIYEETKCFLRMTHDEVQTILSLLPKTHIEYKSLIIEETLPIIQSLSRKVLFPQVCVCVCYMSVHSCGNTWLEVTLSPHKQTQLSQHNCFA